MTNQDITDAWAKIYGRKEADRLVGAVGSSEPPADPWRGLSGPTGPVATLSAVASVNGVTIVSGDTIHVRSDGVYVNDKNVAPQNMSGFTMLEFGNGVARETLASMHANQEAYFGKPEIPVTSEMRAAGARLYDSAKDDFERSDLDAIYRAMAALAPVELVTANEDRIVALETAVSEKDREIVQLRAEREAWKYLYEMAKPDSDTRMLRADETGSHDYIGPVKDGKAIPDPTHERFHGSVGDVIAGNVMRPARDQMERALADARVKDGKTPPPFPSAHALPDHRRIGS